MNPATHRKPYIRPVRASWWLSRKKYIGYMLREFTAVTNLWITIELFALILIGNLSLLTHPIVIVLNAIAMIGVLGHLITWYSIFPKGIRLFTSRNPSNTRLIPPIWFTLSLYFVTIVASAILFFALSYNYE